MKLVDARREAPMTIGCIAISSLARNMLAFMNFAQQARPLLSAPQPDTAWKKYG